MDIKEALSKLDPENDDHWTSDGLPRVDVVNDFLEEVVTRAQITEADPEFIRPIEEDEEETPPEESQEEPMADPLKELDDLMEAQKAEMHKLTQEAEAVNEKLMAKTNEYLRTNEQRQQMTPRDSNQENIRQYLESQKKVTREKFDRRTKILQNLDVKDLHAKSPIDQAMSRKTTRGTQRPVRV